MSGGVRRPITLIFRDELIVADVAFDHEPTPAEVRQAAYKVARERDAIRVVLPVEWRNG